MKYELVLEEIEYVDGGTEAVDLHSSGCYDTEEECLLMASEALREAVTNEWKIPFTHSYALVINEFDEDGCIVDVLEPMEDVIESARDAALFYAEYTDYGDPKVNPEEYIEEICEKCPWIIAKLLPALFYMEEDETIDDRWFALVKRYMEMEEK